MASPEELNASQTRTPSRKLWSKALLIVLCALVIIAASVYLSGVRRDSSPDDLVSSQGAPPAGEDGDEGDSVLEAAKTAGCDLNPGEILDPTRFIMVDDGRTLPIMSLSRDETDAAGAPPVSEGYTVGWFNEGPTLGSRRGKAVLTSHTYFTGTALGNELNDGLWKPGTIIKIEDWNGKNACYAYRNNLQIMVDDYDPESSIVYDDEHSPMFAMVVCSNWDTDGNPLGRTIYYADLITEDYSGQSMQAK